MDKLEKILEKIKQEGDYKKFTHKGLLCEIVRNGDMGNLCGYVYIPKYSKLCNFEEHELPVRPHGGVTFTSMTDDGFKVGFDCAHSGDLVPRMVMLERKIGMSPLGGQDIYRDMKYVEKEVRQMADDIFDADSTIGIQIREDKIDDIVD